MAEPYVDRVDTLSCTEDRGVIRSLTRKVRVIFSAAELAEGGRIDAAVCVGALKVCDTQGLEANSVIGNVRDADDRYAPLTLVKRTASLVDGEPSVVDVVLQYEHIMDGPNQQLMAPPQGYIYGKGKTSIVQKSTNNYFPYGIRTDPAKRTQILVSHQFPDWETGIAAVPFNPNYPRTIFQGGEIDIPYPQSNYGFAGIVRTNAPRKLAGRIIATINEVEWQGDPPLTWICSEIQWEVLDPGEAPADGLTSYKMQFEFQYNVDTWDPTVVFIDQRTGRPPANVLKATDEDDNGVLSLVVDPTKVLGDPTRARPAGMWQVPALRRLKFDEFFGALFDGSLPPGVL